MAAQGALLEGTSTRRIGGRRYRVGHIDLAGNKLRAALSYILACHYLIASASCCSNY